MSLPPEVLEYQLAHAHESRQGAVIAAIAVTLSLAVASVILRFIARYIARTPLKADDWLVLVSLVFAIGYSTCDGLSVRFGLGRHSVLLTEVTSFLANSVAAEILWAAALMVVKISIILLYLRLFPSKRFRIVAFSLLSFVVAYSVASIFTFLFQCTPIEKSWDLAIPGTCINISAAFPATGAINVLTDIAILSLPISQVLKLQLDMTRKLQVMAMFLLGALVVVISITRVVYVERVSTLDSTWTFTDASIWTQSEVCAAIVSACLPTYRPLVQGKVGSIRNTYAQNEYKGYGKASHSYRKMGKHGKINRSGDEDIIPLGAITQRTDITIESSAVNSPQESRMQSQV